MSARGVVFDLDGTLADTLADLTAAVNAGLSHIGCAARSADDVRRWIGEGQLVLCRRAIVAARPAGSGEPDDATVADMAAAFTEHYRRHRLDRTRPYPGVAEMLDALAAGGLTLGVFSNKPHEHTAALVEALFARWPWSVVEGSREGRPRKPDPRITREVIARMGLEPGEILMVGDSAPDIQAARAVGAVAVGVTWGFRSRRELLSAGADHLIDRPSALPPLLWPSPGR